MVRHAQVPARSSALIPAATPIRAVSGGGPADSGGEVADAERGWPPVAMVGAGAGGFEVADVPDSTSAPIWVSEGPWAKTQSSIAAAGLGLCTGAFRDREGTRQK